MCSFCFDRLLSWCMGLPNPLQLVEWLRKWECSPTNVESVDGHSESCCDWVSYTCVCHNTLSTGKLDRRRLSALASLYGCQQPSVSNHRPCAELRNHRSGGWESIINPVFSPILVNTKSMFLLFWASPTARFTYVVQPHYSIPGCNGVLVTMFGSLGLIRSLIETVY